jgi:hypothetical protein
MYVCDNVGHLRFKKNSDGDFKIDGMGLQYQIGK